MADHHLTQTCSHIGSVAEVPPSSRVCDECVALGDRWVHLRACLSCGHVGCCDSSKNKHATRHFRSSGHPLVRSLEPGETWIWCYADEIVLTDE
ncbi:MAG: UBP-type zinc finger domain-containing protein [Gemmatimonadaceae bacterium]